MLIYQCGTFHPVALASVFNDDDDAPDPQTAVSQ